MNQRTWPNVAVFSVLLVIAFWLGVSRPGSAQPGQAPFRNPVEQREQMIHELQEIKALIKQQNELLSRLQKQ